MTKLIDACESIDMRLAAAFTVTVKPTLLLQGVEAASLISWLQSAIQSMDDEALKSGDWKKVLGTYLVNGKAHMVKFLEKRNTITDSQEIYDLQRVLHEAARDTEIPLVIEPVVPAGEIADSILLLSDATDPLIEADSVRYITQDETDMLNTKFRVSRERIEELLTQETIVNHAVMILKVKKPDFLGDSMWDFRYEGKRLTAKVLDDSWLKRFHDGEVVLRPGDALRGQVDVETRYGRDKEVIVIHHRVTKVDEIIAKA
jgi:hypothetical protein